jgi:plasmid stabilization system protein ParE
MASKYTIRYLPVAVDDLISIFDWIAQDSPARAGGFVDVLDKRIGNLAAHPLIGRVPQRRKTAEVWLPRSYHRVLSCFLPCPGPHR